ncbi:hypothetical protein [Actinokineospora sp.]|uniref:hypothetical protein n=1 Tax=Actinokineospora sp. TaxID=1872133 RepID=UPI004037FE7D
MTALAVGGVVLLGVLVVGVAAVGAILAVRQRRTRNQPMFRRYEPSGWAARWERTRDDPDHPPSGVWLPTDHDEPDTLARLAIEWERQRRERGGRPVRGPATTPPPQWPPAGT